MGYFYRGLGTLVVSVALSSCFIFNDGSPPPAIVDDVATDSSDVNDIPVDRTCNVADPLDSGGDQDGDGYEGVVIRSVYVDPDLGDDENSGGPTDPIASLHRAVELLNGDRPTILLAEGGHDIDSLALEALPCIEIGGGYDPSNWTRTAGARSQIDSSQNPAVTLLQVETGFFSQVEIIGPVGSDGLDGFPTSLDYDEEAVEAGIWEARAGENSVGIVAYESTVFLQSCRIEAGDGGNGGQGRAGLNGADGNPGGAGARGALCGASTCPEAAGGEFPEACWPGIDQSVFHIEGMDEAVGGEGETTSSEGDPEDGSTGREGYPTNDGVGGGGYGYLRGGQWHPVFGQSGGWGGPGAGGTGGSNGFRAERRIGGGGGGGGSGGCGGLPDGGGAGGGGSLAVYLEASALHVSDSQLVTGDGGAGGDGGPGGQGGEGGSGGDGGIGAIITERAGSGGNGGSGNPGGHGGGGGGGVSVGVVMLGGSAYWPDNVQLRLGEGGAGGRGFDLSPSAGQGSFATEVYEFPELEYGEDCPYGSVPLESGNDGSECISIYEASAAREALRGRDGGELLPLGGDSQAVSLPFAPPRANIAYWDAHSSCLRGGGHLCDEHTMLRRCEFAPDVDQCNFSGELAETGQFSECVTGDLGVHDLLGNVAEWVDGSQAESGNESLMPVFGWSAESTTPNCEELDHRVIARSDDEGEDYPAYTDVGFRCCHSTEFHNYFEYDSEEDRGSFFD